MGEHSSHSAEGAIGVGFIVGGAVTAAEVLAGAVAAVAAVPIAATCAACGVAILIAREVDKRVERASCKDCL